MSLPSHYYSLYVQICGRDQVPVGSGICIDEEYILTCAHVVNAATGKKKNSFEKVSEPVQVLFPQSELLNDQSFTATVTAWGWDHPRFLEVNANRFDYLTYLLKHDFAILKIDATVDTREFLKKESKQLRFIKGGLGDQAFEALSFNPEQPGIINYVTGSFGIEDKKAGSTILNPPANSKLFFFDFGSSGSPVYCKTILDDGSILEGIAGYADFLNKKKDSETVDARLINTANIEKLWLHYLPERKLKTIDVDVRRSSVKKSELTSKILTERGKTGNEILCDRAPQIEEVKRRNFLKLNSRLFLIHGSERQKLDAFIDRYRYEFIASSGCTSQVAYFKMPKEKELNFFCNTLVANIYRAFRTVAFDNVSPTKLSIADVIESLGLSPDIHYVIDCRIENGEFSEFQKPLYDWFYNQFLSPLQKNEEQLSNIHLFISYYYKAGEPHLPNEQIILNQFASFQLPVLGNVERQHVEEWLDYVEGRDIDRRRRIIEFYPDKNEYDMTEIVDYYKQAIYNLDKF